MKQSKRQLTRDDLAAAWKTIRDQSQIVKLQSETIRRQEKVLGNVLMAYPRLEEFESKLIFNWSHRLGSSSRLTLGVELDLDQFAGLFGRGYPLPFLNGIMSCLC